MDLVIAGKKALRTMLAHHGLHIRRFDKQELHYVLHGYDPSVPLPASAAELTYDNPHLRALIRSYINYESPVCNHTQWKVQLQSEAMNLQYFRGDNVYVWQYRHLPGDTRLKYYLYLRYIRERDTRSLLGEALTEDGQFGCFTFRFLDQPRVSRDLLDSLNEIYFLDRNWGLFGRNNAQILDIGAGYGRLAHRMLFATKSIERYWCIDAIPTSSFLCDYYLRYRGLIGGQSSRASVIPIYEMSRTIATGGVDIAINVHSFSEMSYAAVEAWIRWLVQNEVPWLFIIPNEPEMLTWEPDGTRREFRSLIERQGYHMVTSEPTLQDPEIREILGVNDTMFLFRHRDSSE